MKLLFAYLLIFTNHCFSQNTPTDFWKDRCSYTTDGSGKSLGLKLKLNVPCSWRQADGERPHVVKKFVYNSDYTASISFTIIRMPAFPTKAEKDEILTQQGMKEMAAGTFISGRKVVIDGLDCAEIVSKLQRESSVGSITAYFIQYLIVYQNKMINISYSVGTSDPIKTKELYESYKTLFKGLAANTVLLSKWK